MINEILRKHKLINEAAAIKKDSFKYFFVDEIKNIDTIADVEDLGDLKNVEILLTTDKNYVAGVKPSKGDWYKIDTEDLIKFMEKTVDKFEAGDYLDFISSYSLEDLIKNYLEHTYKFKCFNKWADFVGAMEGAGKIEGLQENTKFDDDELYQHVIDTYKHNKKRMSIDGSMARAYKKLQSRDGYVYVIANSRGEGSVGLSDKGLEHFGLK